MYLLFGLVRTLLNTEFADPAHERFWIYNSGPGDSGGFCPWCWRQRVLRPSALAGGRVFRSQGEGLWLGQGMRVVGRGRRARATTPLARPPRPDNKLLSASLGNPLLHIYLFLYCPLVAGRRGRLTPQNRVLPDPPSGPFAGGALPLIAVEVAL
jgi:hypothetical protein